MAWFALFFIRIFYDTEPLLFIGNFLLFLIVPMLFGIMFIVKFVRRFKKTDKTEKKVTRNVIATIMIGAVFCIAVFLVKNLFSGDFAPPGGS